MEERTRCPWCLVNERETRYHDEVWGTPVHDDRKQFEHLAMESLQCGLSWDTVLKKQETIRACFADFDIDAVAAFGPGDVERILDTPGMIRSRPKIEAVIGNARVVQEIRREYGSFSEWLWQQAGGEPLLCPSHGEGKIPASTELSARLAKELRRRGMRYVGPVTMYAHMQSTGMVNDHLRTCWRYAELLDRFAYRTVEED